MSEQNPGERFSPDDDTDVTVDETVAFTPQATPEGVVYREESVEMNFTPHQDSEIPLPGQSEPVPPQPRGPSEAPLPGPDAPYGYPQPNAPYTQAYPQPGQPFNQPYPGQTYEQVRVEEVPWSTKSKLAAGLFGILLGSFGVHNFYLGYTGKGVAQLLITVLSFGLLSWVSAIWGLVEGILILASEVGTQWDLDANGQPMRPVGQSGI